jgi:CRISPR system Cascade subunit CasB
MNVAAVWRQSERSGSLSNDQISTRQRQVGDFIAALERLDAAGRARLRRNAGRTLAEARDVHRAFFQALPYDLAPWQHEDYFLVAALFPLVPHRAGAGSLGLTLRRVRQGRSQGGERANSLDRRFQTLIDSDREQVPFRLRQAVRLAAADEQPIDWADLLRDMLAWEHADRYVQLRWARDFYVAGAPVEVSKPQP